MLKTYTFQSIRLTKSSFSRNVPGRSFFGARFFALTPVRSTLSPGLFPSSIHCSLARSLNTAGSFS